MVIICYATDIKEYDTEDQSYLMHHSTQHKKLDANSIEI